MAKFGTVFCDTYVSARFEEGRWLESTMQATTPIPLHPAAHVFHYASTCFEGFKAYRWQDGKARIFRLHDHVARMQKSAASLRLPVPDADMLANMVQDLVARLTNEIPAPPSSLYLRPTLIGTEANIGAAAAPSRDALLYVIASPVGDYFSGGAQTLKLLVDDEHARTTDQLGSTKTGGNYAAALGPTLDAKAEFGVDQVLFCPNGNVQETGAANFLLISDSEIITKPLDSSFLHGITRDSVLKLAADHGYRVDERNFTVNELLQLIETHEAALSGTAATLSSVGGLVYRGKEYVVCDGSPGKNAKKLSAALQAIQNGTGTDTYGWLTEVEGLTA
jgi:branched-chain amino acid aminotransferase